IWVQLILHSIAKLALRDSSGSVPKGPNSEEEETIMPVNNPLTGPARLPSGFLLKHPNLMVHRLIVLIKVVEREATIKEREAESHVMLEFSRKREISVRADSVFSS